MEEYDLPTGLSDDPHTLLIDREKETVEFIFTISRGCLAEYTFSQIREHFSDNNGDYWSRVKELIGPPTVIINTN